MRANTTRQACAFQAGYRAAKAGKPVTANRHKKGTIDHEWWVKGYEAPICGTCGGEGAVGTIETAQPCPDCSSETGSASGV